MSEGQDDYQRLIEQQRFLGEIEQGIRYVNREVIHKHIPSINKDIILSFAVSVGRLRARYLESAFKLGVNDQGETPDPSAINELKNRKEMFEEARLAFEALREAIEKGYVDVEGIQDTKGE